MRLEIREDARSAAARAAAIIADALRTALAARHQAVAALSGGSTAPAMLRELARLDLEWPGVHVFQVDERVVARTDPRRNLAELSSAFAATPGARIHAMPVEAADAEAAARDYARALARAAGAPCVLDVAHLGLGEDGHTASLVPGDTVLASTDDVAVTAPYAGTRRMTLTLAVLNRARQRVWLVTGPKKRDVLRRLLRGDRALVAALVRAEDSVVVADRAAAGEPA
jgi:6-phosphogluconolactonase